MPENMMREISLSKKEEIWYLNYALIMLDNWLLEGVNLFNIYDDAYIWKLQSLFNYDLQNVWIKSYFALRYWKLQFPIFWLGTAKNSFYCIKIGIFKNTFKTAIKIGNHWAQIHCEQPGVQVKILAVTQAESWLLFVHPRRTRDFKSLSRPEMEVEQTVYVVVDSKFFIF